MTERSGDEHLVAVLRRASTAGRVWGLRSAEGWAAVPSSVPDADVYVVWTSRGGAERCARDEWADYAPAEIPMANFIAKWLPGMKQEGYRVGFDWDADLNGAEHDPEDVVRVLRKLGDEAPD